MCVSDAPATNPAGSVSVHCGYDNTVPIARSSRTQWSHGDHIMQVTPVDVKRNAPGTFSKDAACSVSKCPGKRPPRSARVLGDPFLEEPGGAREVRPRPFGMSAFTKYPVIYPTGIPRDFLSQLPRVEYPPMPGRFPFRKCPPFTRRVVAAQITNRI